ncbi:glycosyltransferase [Aquiluna sp.]|nr:glycosyltransferase [Aquiluna sp.]
MNLLFIHEVNYLTKPIFEMHEFPEYLSKQGHDIGFLHFLEKHGEMSGGEHKLPWRSKANRLEPGGSITLFTPSNPFSSNILNRLVAALRGFSLVSRAIRDARPDVVVLYAVPTWGWQAVLVCRRLRIPLVYRAIDVSYLIRKSVFKPLIWLSELAVIRLADKVLANSAAMLDRCLVRGAISGSVCPPIITSENWQISNVSEARRRIIFVGSLFEFSGVEEFLVEFNRQASPNDELLIVGGGARLTAVKDLVGKLGLQHVETPGWIPFEELGRLLGESKVAINPMLRSAVSEYALPNKVLQYLRMGLPVVSTRLKGLSSYFPTTGECGLHFRDDPESQVRLALELLDLPEVKVECPAMGQFDRSSATVRFESELTRLCRQRKS